MTTHTCHALGCKRYCPPAHLMCGPCWAQVPRAMQLEVYRTVRLRGPNCDASWAPWWRAQAKAIHAVAMKKEPDDAKGAKWLAHELAVAEKLEGRA